MNIEQKSLIGKVMFAVLVKTTDFVFLTYLERCIAL